MKKLALTALFALCLCAPLPAQAADWTNGTVSCDMKDIELTPSIWPWNWGKWGYFDLKYYLTADSNSSITYRCISNEVGSEEFICYLDLIKSPDWRKWNMITDTTNYTFKPGTTKSQACAAVFNGAHISKR